MNNYLIVTGGYTDDNFAVRWIKDNNFDCMLASDSGMEFSGAQVLCRMS